MYECIPAASVTPVFCIAESRVLDLFCVILSFSTNIFLLHQLCLKPVSQNQKSTLCLCVCCRVATPFVTLTFLTLLGKSLISALHAIPATPAWNLHDYLFSACLSIHNIPEKNESAMFFSHGCPLWSLFAAPAAIKQHNTTKTLTEPSLWAKKNRHIFSLNNVTNLNVVWNLEDFSISLILPTTLLHLSLLAPIMKNHINNKW